METKLERESSAWGIEPVPPEHRRLGSLDFLVLWGDLGIGLLVLVTGSLLVPALGFSSAFGAIVLGSILGCIPLALVGVAGSREGVPGMVLLRPLLGIRGSYVPTILNLAQLLGWTAFELWAMALVASRVTGPLFGLDSFFIWLGVAAVVCLVLSLGGPVLVVRRWMERFGAWVIAGVAAWITFRLFATADVGEIWSRPGAGGYPTFWAGVDLAIALPVSWIPLVADYNRFARSGVSSAAGTYVGYLLANVWFYSLGALLILGAGAPEPSVTGIADGILALTGGAVVLLALLVGETDEAFADVYSAAVSSQNLRPRIAQRPAIVVVTAVGVGVAAWLFGQPGEGVLTYEFFLLLIGSLFVPLFAVFVADYFILRHRGFDRRTLFEGQGANRAPAGFRPVAFAAWLLGFAAFHAVAPTPLPGWQRFVESVFGPPLFGGEAPASIVAFVIGLVAYLGLSAVFRSRRAPAEEPSPRGGQQDPARRW